MTKIEDRLNVVDNYATGRYKKAVDNLLVTLKPKDFNRDSNAFDMGYEQAKRDILARVQRDINV